MRQTETNVTNNNNNIDNEEVLSKKENWRI